MAIFSVSAVLLAVFSDQNKDSIPRAVILGAGTALLSSGFSSAKVKRNKTDFHPSLLADELC